MPVERPPHQLADCANDGWRAWLVPLAADRSVVAASMTMLARRRAGWLAWVSLGTGIAASLAANIVAV